MSYYKPTQPRIHYVYDHNVNNVSIKSYVTVRLKAGESLANSRKVYDAATNTTVKEFVHDRDDSQLAPYDYLDDTPVEIIGRVDIPYDEHDQDAFKRALSGTFAESYAITAIVRDKPDEPDTGGQVTNTISQSGTIEII
jgi:hypothetical protein